MRLFRPTYEGDMSPMPSPLLDPGVDTEISVLDVLDILLIINKIGDMLLTERLLQAN